MTVSIVWSAMPTSPWDSQGAVSYTHLDVYKRQVQRGVQGALPHIENFARNLLNSLRAGVAGQIERASRPTEFR